MSEVFGQAAVLVAVGLLALAAAVVAGLRTSRGASTVPFPNAAPLVPWLGSVLAVALAVRGSLAGAAFVLLATVAHALRVRWRVARDAARHRRGG
ncbi:hypothetical protein [Egicoccus sp. AB-alg6-2]|uniref:hypothetical protein n=1 Tax=Egicoccus sp. AB-alg6-2 TaxID=3242692 RepID=UPI00359E597E